MDQVLKPSEAFPFSDLPALPAISRFLERVLPGESSAILRVRQQILEFSACPTARAVLLRGPIGAGKSTVARVIALTKRVAPLELAKASQMLELAQFDAWNQTKLLQYVASWYVELPLTGLVETLAEAQLFGSTRNAYTGATDRPGVFEAASRGRVQKGQQTVGARVTGGVVFLDEIGDLSEKLQAKLLPVLSGGVFYRLGDEGKEDADLHFHGVIITASWKELDEKCLRPDLLSRVAPYAIDVPGVDERFGDFDLLLDGIEAPLIDNIRETMSDLSKADEHAARGYWRTRMETLKPMKRADRDVLKQVSWSSHGNLRGLTAAVEQILAIGADPRTVVANLPRLETTGRSPQSTDGLFERLLARGRTDGGLAAQLRAIEREDRRTLREKLQGDRNALRRLSEALGIDATKLRSQLRHIDRERRFGEDSQ
jgi:DNA-binding NtrC family response regulator